MAGEIKLNKNQQLELKGLNACGENGTFWPVKEADKFEKLGVVQVAKNVTNEEGEVAVRINDAGKAYLVTLEAKANESQKNNEQGVDTDTASQQNGNQQGAEGAANMKTQGAVRMSAFLIESNVALPTTTARASSAVYPFDQLEVGQSFFVPATEAKPEPHVSLASTVASANKRHAVEIEGETRVDRKGNTVAATRQVRKFIVRKDVKDEVVGARVWRVEVPAGE